MYSMTGYGKGVAEKGGVRITVELKTVNHRYLDYGVKLPKGFMFLDDSVKKAISAAISRGHIDMYLTSEQTAEANSPFTVNAELAKGFMQAVRELDDALAEYLLQDDVTLGYVAKVPDVIVKEQKLSDEEQEELLRELTLGALDEALKKLVAMRASEGEMLKADISQKLDNIEGFLKEVEKLAPAVTENYRKALEARISEVVGEGVVDKQRLATEVALYADHCAIDEEITRLKAHIANMRSMLSSGEPVGRRMDFLVQEFNREANTIGSKANDLQITNLVLAIKNEIEKMREQAANVE